MRRYDVIVVGAGPAGSTLAIVLARAGLDVLILDKDRFPRDKTCGDFVGPAGLRVLRQLGCLADIERRNCLPVHRSRVYVDDELAFAGQIPVEEPDWGYGYIVPRYDLDDALLEIAYQAGAQGMEGCRAQGFALESGGVCVTAEGPGGREILHARLVVGADGANSAIAAAASLAASDPRYIHLSQRAYARGLDLQGETVLWFGERYFPGFGWFFPVADGRANIGVGLASSAARKHKMRLPEFMEAMTTLATRWAREQGAELQLGPVTGWVLKTYGGQQRIYFERGLLIGDAGSFVDPVSGQGISTAMVTAELAAQTIDDAFAAGDFSQRFLSRYQARCTAALETDLILADLLVSVARNRYLAHIWMDILRLVCDAVQRDPECARQLGGIMSGATGAAGGLSLDVVVKALVHKPQFWLGLMSVERGQGAKEALAQLERRSSRDLDALSEMLADDDWFSDWWYEIQLKQLDVLNVLSAKRSRQ